MSIAHYTDLLFIAAKTGNLDDVGRLIPLSDPKTHNSWALVVAAANGHAECVELLIPVSNPKANASRALQYAVKNGHDQCVDLLYPVSDPVVALRKLKHRFSKGDPHKWMVFENRIEAEKLNRVLNAAIDDPDKHTNTLKVQRKM